MCTFNRLLLILSLIGLPVFTWAQFDIERNEMRAQLMPLRLATLSAEMPAKIEKVKVLEGQRFKSGQVLVEFDCEMQRAQHNKMLAQLAVAKNNYVGNQHLADLKAIGLVELNNSEAEVQKAQADVDYLQATIKKCEILAPFSGRTGDIKVRSQQFVKLGDPLLDVFDDSKLELEFIVPSHWLAWLAPGYKFEVFIEDTQHAYPVLLDRLAGHVDPLSHTVKAVAVVDGEFSELLVGMSGYLLLESKPKVN